MEAARKRAQACADAARGGPRWHRTPIPYPPPPAVPPKAYRCPACIRAGVELADLPHCDRCGQRACTHRMKVLRVDGGGYCRRCAWARARAFNEAFGLSRVAEAVELPDEE
jgi:hypothetical protein